MRAAGDATALLFIHRKIYLEVAIPSFFLKIFSLQVRAHAVCWTEHQGESISEPLNRDGPHCADNLRGT